MKLIFAISAGLMLAANVQAESLVVYCGRSEQLVGPLMERFEKASGLEVQVRYGKTAQLAATILEEGKRSPADVFFAQDAGALGALSAAGRLKELPESLLDQVDARFISRRKQWVGITGRARVVVYNTEQLNPGDLPKGIDGFLDPKWNGRLGWAPANGSFQAFVTALRKQRGDEGAKVWLEGIQKNHPRVYPKNTPIVAAAGAGEIDAGFVNHYYLYRFKTDAGDFSAANHFLSGGDPGALVNIAGAGILDSSRQFEAAKELIEFLLSHESQEYFATEVKEYPLVPSVSASTDLVPLQDIEVPNIDLSDLEDLKGTLKLLQEAGVL